MTPHREPFEIRAALPARPIVIDADKCAGCNRCADACPIDIFMPGEGRGEPPYAAYPDECWYCGCCVMECPAKAVTLTHPMMNRVRFTLKEALIKGGDGQWSY